MSSAPEIVLFESTARKKRYSIPPVEELVQCRVCGLWGVTLDGHLRTHGLSAAEYRRRFPDARIKPAIWLPELQERMMEWRGGTPWSNEDILRALQAWAARRGRAPTVKEWAKATREHPMANTVATRFGTWNGGLTAAGLTPRRSGAQVTLRRPRWTQMQIIAAMRSFSRSHQRPPTSDDFRHPLRDPERHPDATTVYRVFGSWPAALTAARLPIGRARCNRGHLFTPDNTLRSGGHRRCRTCRRASRRKTVT